MILKIKKHCAALLFLTSHLVYAQASPPGSNPAIAPVSSEVLATQLIRSAGIDQIISGSIKNSAGLFTKSIAETTNVQMRNKIVAAQKQFSSSQLGKEIESDIQKQLTKQFSNAELKYLVQLLTSPTARKFKDFMNSRDVRAINSKAFEKANSMIAQAKKTGT